jgi:hypothetical protein
MIVTRVSETTVIEGDPSPLWAILRDFSNVARWHPDVKDCVIEDGGPGDRAGAVGRSTSGPACSFARR